jgi:hypothetical protein
VEETSSYHQQEAISEHGSQLLRFGERSPKLSVRSLWSQEHFPFKQINVDLAVRTPPLPESRGSRKRRRSVAAFQRAHGMQERGRVQGCSGKAPGYLQPSCGSTPKPGTWSCSKRSDRTTREQETQIEITKNLPDEAESHVGEETMTDPGSCNRSSFSFGQLKTSTLPRCPWVKPPTRSNSQSRPGDPESWKRRGGDQKIPDPVARGRAKADVEVSEEAHQSGRKHEPYRKPQ